MWITRVWNPLFEFPETLQVLQKKVRYYVTWGYKKRLASAASLFSWSLKGKCDLNRLEPFRERNNTDPFSGESVGVGLSDVAVVA